MPPVRPTINEAELKRLIEQYKRAEQSILDTFADATDYGQARRAEQLVQINAILTDLGKFTGEWTDTNLPSAYQRGTTDLLTDLAQLKVGIKETSTMSTIDKRAVAAMISETSEAFAVSLTTISKNASRALSDAVKAAIQDDLAQGRILGETRRQVSDRIAANLKRDGITALTDAGGRTWSLSRYGEMLARTKMVEARNTGLANKMVANGYDLVEVSTHMSAHRDCAIYEGKILSLTGKSSGYPTLDTAKGNGLLHPNCKHQINAIKLDYAAITKAYDPTSKTYKQPFEKNAPAKPTGKITPAKAPKAGAPLMAGVSKGAPMAPKLAAERTNPNFSLGGVWRVNCQRTVPTYELRRRGYDLEALPRENVHTRKIGTYDAIPKLWGQERADFYSYIGERERGDGTTYRYRKRTVKSEVFKFMKSYPEGARVQVSYGYVRYRSAHTIVMERVPVSKDYPDGLMFVDPQVNTISPTLNLTGKTNFMLNRIDDKDIDISLVDYIAKKRGAK